MTLPLGDLDENVSHNFRCLTGVFVSGVVLGLRRHLTQTGHVTGVECRLGGALVLCHDLRLAGVGESEWLPLLSS